MARRRKQRRVVKAKNQETAVTEKKESVVATPSCLTPEEAEAWEKYFSSPEGKVEKSTTTNTGVSGSKPGGYTYKQSLCTHHGDKVVIQLDGINIYCGAKIDLAPGYFLYDTILDVGANIYLASLPIKEVSGFDVDTKLKLGNFIHRPRLVQLDWPDMGVFPGNVGFWRHLWDTFKQHRVRNLLIACQGSHGRTGTALAAIMIATQGYAPAEAASYIRAEHCKEAIETNDQIDYLNNLYHSARAIDKAVGAIST